MKYPRITWLQQASGQIFKDDINGFFPTLYICSMNYLFGKRSMGVISIICTGFFISVREKRIHSNFFLSTVNKYNEGKSPML